MPSLVMQLSLANQCFKLSETLLVAENVFDSKAETRDGATDYLVDRRHLSVIFLLPRFLITANLLSRSVLPLRCSIHSLLPSLTSFSNKLIIRLPLIS